MDPYRIQTSVSLVHAPHGYRPAWGVRRATWRWLQLKWTQSGGPIWASRNHWLRNVQLASRIAGFNILFVRGANTLSCLLYLLQDRRRSHARQAVSLFPAA